MTTQDKTIDANTKSQTLALFDLDHTLLDIDSDYTWGEYIVKQGYVDKDEYQQANDKFYQDYIAGVLDAVEYNQFVAKFLTTKSINELHQIRTQFIESEIIPHIRPQALESIKQHVKNGNDVVIISATNDFVVNAVAEKFNVLKNNVLATPLEIQEDRYTGQLRDKPNFQEGKLYHLNKWLEEKAKQGVYYTKTYAYSDSKNDLPLLEFSDIAICVTPDEKLCSIALEKGWKIVDWSI